MSDSHRAQLLQVTVFVAGAATALAATGGPAAAETDRLKRAPETAERTVQPRLKAVHIVSAIGNRQAIPDDRPKRALASDGITMYAVLEARIDGRRTFFSDVATIRVGGRKRAALPMREAPTAALAWFKVEPEVDNMSNTQSGSFRYERIGYREVSVQAWMLKSTVTAEVRPTLTPDRGQGLGTMRYKVVAHQGDHKVASPGVEARRKGGSGGLTDKVHRISLRRDDTFNGIMTEMFGQPYIWASAGRTRRTHQSERLEGSDCADLMVYGARRKGYDIEYTWTGGMHEYTRVLARGEPREDGVYVDRKGRPIAFPRPGDMLLFDRHIGALVEDRGVEGVLDNQDVMMHTFFASPREQPVSETPYADAPIKVIRWKRKLTR